MPAKIPQEKVDKLFEAHKLNMNISQAARYAGVGRRTVRRHWKKAGLEATNLKHIRQISEQQKNKIFEAYKQNMSATQAAEYAGVSYFTVRNYWKKAGLKCHLKFGTHLSEEKIAKILEAHKLEMSTHQAAEYASVGSHKTVRKYWRRAGLEAHFEFHPPISKEQEDKILETHKLRMSICQAAKYAGVGQSTVSNYLRKAGLKPYFIRTCKVSLEALLDDVFDTKNNPAEELSYEQIVARLKTRGLDEQDLKAKISNLVNMGMYDEIQTDNGIRYKAGMPAAMDGCVRDGN